MSNYETYALVGSSGQVVNIIMSDGTFTPPGGETAIPVGSTGAGIGWSYANGTFTAPPAPVRTLAQQAAALLSGTVTVTSASTPSLNGTYTITATDQAHLDAEITSILLNGIFADGTSTVEWPDTATPPVNHAFTVAQFKTLASAIAAFVAACAKCINGVSATLPSNQLSIP